MWMRTSMPRYGHFNGPNAIKRIGGFQAACFCYFNDDQFVFHDSFSS